MAEDEQKKIFASNLSWYVASSGKAQKEVAADLLVNEKTFNGWCKGVSMPKMWTIQKVADYFRIPKSRLLDNWMSDQAEDAEELGRDLARKLIDLKMNDAFEKCINLSDEDRQMVIGFIDRLYGKD